MPTRGGRIQARPRPAAHARRPDLARRPSAACAVNLPVDCGSLVGQYVFRLNFVDWELFVQLQGLAGREPFHVV